MEEKLKNILKSSFMQNFYMERVATDLMDLVEKIDIVNDDGSIVLKRERAGDEEE